LLSRIASKEVVQRLLIVVLLAGVFFLSAAIVAVLSFRGRTVEVPNVVGKSESEAAEELQDAGLRIKVTNRVHNTTVGAASVIDQSPAAGAIVKSGQIVRVSISLGAANQARIRPAGCAEISEGPAGQKDLPGAF
jgi:beta-lactam-binding protein with PASTA domain